MHGGLGSGGLGVDAKGVCAACGGHGGGGGGAFEEGVGGDEELWAGDAGTEGLAVTLWGWDHGGVGGGEAGSVYSKGLIGERGMLVSEAAELE